MNFDDFVRNYYSPDQQSEIGIFLDGLSVYNDIKNTLNNFYKAAGDRNKMEIITQLVITCKDMETIIDNALQKISPGNEKVTTELKIRDFVVYMIKDTYHHSGLKIQEYFDLLRQTVMKTHPQKSLDFSVLEKLLSFDNMKTSGLLEKENKNGNIIKHIKPVKLHWQGEKQLDFFIDDVIKTFLGIKCKKLVYLLFDKKDTDFKIELKSKYLLPFLTLFHELHESGKIRVIGNRGLFIFLNLHLQPPDNDRYPKRDFRKLRYEAVQNERSRHEIFRMINPLLKKYRSNGQ